MTAVKICGINSPAAFDAAVDAGADFIGFNFFPASPRYITADIASRLSARVTGGPGRIGLFVDPDDDSIAAVLAGVPLAALQLYGTEERAVAVRQRFGLPVWRSVAVTGRGDLPVITAGIDRLVLEAQAPVSSAIPGGNATKFDWSLLRGWAAPLPWLLAGGLTPENVAAAIGLTGAPGVDVSSGVESARGVKDPALIRAFVAGVRAA